MLRWQKKTLSDALYEFYEAETQFIEAGHVLLEAIADRRKAPMNDSIAQLMARMEGNATQKLSALSNDVEPSLAQSEDS